jgi:hypothetical protein
LFSYTPWEALAKIGGFHVELASENPYGVVKSGWIGVESPIFSLVLAGSRYRGNDPEGADPIHPTFLFFCSAGGDIEAWGGLDFAEWKHAEVEEIAKAHGNVFALVLAIAGTGGREWRR